MTKHEHKGHGPSLESYVIGFSCSVFLTVIAFGLAYSHVTSDHELFSHDLLLPGLVSLALVQLLVQSFFFLHVSGRPEGRMTLTTYVFTAFMVAFVVVGSLWIMRHLEQNMTPDQIDAYMHKQN